jgi:subtilisin family serine protease
LAEVRLGNGDGTFGVSYTVATVLVAVRVLTCAGTGSTSGVIAGVDWVTGNHQADQPAVANMSLGGGQSPTLDQAVQNSIADGIGYAVAAGNDTADACGGSPATMSRTSMATPHVVGAAALYLQRSPSASPQQVRNGLFQPDDEAHRVGRAQRERQPAFRQLLTPAPKGRVEACAGASQPSWAWSWRCSS